MTGVQTCALPIWEGEAEYRGWVALGGTSVASPIIAATFALAGGAETGANGTAVEYPAQTLYENLATHRGALHDITSGSNGECATGFYETTGLSECTLAAESASCRDTAICVAGPGYDGPSGVGTPHGVVAFQPESEAEHTKQVEEEATKAEEQRRIAEEKKAAEKKAREEQGAAEEKKKAEEELKFAEEKTGSPEGGTGPSGSTATTGSQPNANPSASTSAASAPLAAPLESPEPVALVPVLSALALTKTATATLSHGKPKVSQVAFAFTLSVAARVQVTLAKLITVHGHKRWKTLPYSLTIAGAKGYDRAHLGVHRVLAPGRYRLTLAPLHGTARTLTFRVG